MIFSENEINRINEVANAYLKELEDLHIKIMLDDSLPRGLRQNIFLVSCCKTLGFIVADTIPEFRNERMNHINQLIGTAEILANERMGY